MDSDINSFDDIALKLIGALGDVDTVVNNINHDLEPETSSLDQKVGYRRLLRYIDRILSAYMSLKCIDNRMSESYPLEAVRILESLGGVFNSAFGDYIIQLADAGYKYSKEIYYVGMLYFLLRCDERGKELKEKYETLVNRSEP